MAAAGEGEILVSRTVRDLIAGSEIELEERGAHQLKGVAGDWLLYALVDEQ
jgi:class 3 adenylate cyclase